MVRRLSLCFLAACLALCARAGAVEVKEKWLFYQDSLATATQTDKFISTMEQAKKAGYTHVLLDDVYLQTACFMPQSYIDNTARARKAAGDIGIVVVPNIFNVGYSWRVLYYDSNLAEGIPARDVRFIVKDGVATADPVQVPKVVNAGFDGGRGEPVAGWAPDEFSAACVSLDTRVKHSGSASLKMTDFKKLPEKAEGGCVVTQTVAVEPFKYYRLTIWRKTKGVKAVG